MALLGLTKYEEYEVRMMDDFENMIINYVLASNAERAAWQAMELSSRRNLTLKDVRLISE